MTNAKLEEGTDDTVVGDFPYGIRLSILILLRVSLFAVIWTQ
jgi:tRNA G10  N-methylase Trm11